MSATHLNIKWLLAVLIIGVIIWATLHNPVVTADEQARIGGGCLSPSAGRTGYDVGQKHGCQFHDSEHVSELH